MPLSYARAVGERLRNLRRQQGRSLLAVEEASGREFKASVLGAYERGERIISVLRLQRLAQLYGVPVDQLLPRPAAAGSGFDAPLSPNGPERVVISEPVTIDLLRLAALEAPEKEVLRRYVNMIADPARGLQRPGHHDPPRGRVSPGPGVRARRSDHAQTPPGTRSGLDRPGRPPPGPARDHPPAGPLRGGQRPKIASQASLVDGL